MSRTMSDLSPGYSIPTSTQSLLSCNGNGKRDFEYVDMDYSYSWTCGSTPWTGINNSSSTDSQPRFSDVQVYDPAEYCSKFSSDFDANVGQYAAKKRRVSCTDQSQALSTPSDYTSTLCVPHDPLLSTSMSTNLSEISPASSEAMSRQSSVTSASMTDAFDMLRVESTLSHPSDLFHIDDVDASFVPSVSEQPASSFTTTGFPDDRAAQLLGNIGYGSGCTDFSFVGQDFSAVAGGPQEACDTAFLVAQAQDMQRTKSEESTSSTSSADVKASERRRKHIHNAKQNIAPKYNPAGPTSSGESVASNAKSTPISSHDPTSKRKEAIPKATYIRPQHPKLYCHRCEKFPGGFRGEHELRRHFDRAHAESRKVWICTEPMAKTEWWPQKPLGSCKHCKQRKHYNVYYNAAAHLRRAHFCPRKRGRKARGEERESRAGKAGGDWPPIEWLKLHGWLKEIEVSSADAFESMFDQSQASGFLDESSTSMLETYDDFTEMVDDIGLNALGFQTFTQQDLSSGYPTPIDANLSFASSSSSFASSSNGFVAAAPLMEHSVSAPPALPPSAMYSTHAGFVQGAW